jgi:hypothetical protein
MQKTAARLAGLSGVVLIVASVAGLVSTQFRDVAPATAVTPAEPAIVTAVQARPDPTVSSTSDKAPATLDTVPAVRMSGPHDHYPLHVGRFWVYRYQEPGSDVITVIERVIVRRESRADGKELFIFDDGGVVYYENGKVFEMSSGGGVNIIPVDTAGTLPPILYRSQGMQIEKWFGAVDTSLVVAGHRFDAVSKSSPVSALSRAVPRGAITRGDRNRKIWTRRATFPIRRSTHRVSAWWDASHGPATSRALWPSPWPITALDSCNMSHSPRELP